MNKTLLVVLTCVITLLGCDEDEQVTFDPSKKFDLRVTVTGVTDEGGNIYIGIRDKNQTVVAEHIGPAVEASTVLLEQIPAGEYDVFTFQDIDANNQLAMAGMMPKEPLGYSGNNILTGPPQFSATSFKLTENSEQTIKLFDYR